jgi:tetratricopeptide (TPR) repeat protein
MKKWIFFLLLVLTSNIFSAQLTRPMASPLSKVEQRIGLTDIAINYSRPSKNEREIFGNVVPFDELWRLGANENTKITISDYLIFGNDTLASGTYAIFTKPSVNNWEFYFYTDTDNWGTPDVWEDSKVAMTLSAVPSQALETTETFTITFDNLTTNSGNLVFLWDKTKITLPFSVPTSEKMNASIDKLMSGPTAGDYYAAAEFYFKENKEPEKALIWITKAVELRPEAYWILRLKSQIQAANEDYKGAIESAKKSLELAEKEGNQTYIDYNKQAIEEWGKKKK